MGNARKRDDGWLTVPGAAKALGESRLSVLSRSLRGELVSEQRAGQTFITRKSVEQVARLKRNAEAALAG